MPDLAQSVVTNTTPLIALAAATGSLDALRRIARLCNLNVTGSIGVLLKARSKGYSVVIPEALERMQERGIWLSQEVIRFALAQ
jgi:predicted nucleic acid-binding protein